MAEANKYKMLILIADVGGGHMAPAKAIKYAFEQKYPEYEVQIMDLYAVTDVAPFNTSEASYTLVTHNYTLQRINDLIAWLCNTAIGNKVFRSYAEAMLLNPTKAVINSLEPDLVLTNHPIVTGIVSSVKARGGRFFSIAQITDLDIFMRMGADRSADMVISPSEMSTARLINWGVEPERIVTGLFSLRPQIGKLGDRQLVASQLGLDPKLKTIVIMGGGVGFNRYLLDAIDSLIDQTEYQVILMTGKLNKLADTLEEKYHLNKRVRVQRFIENIQDIYTVADVIVGKPGMSIMLESEIFEKPTVMTRWLADQEKGNVNYMIKNPKFRYLGDNWDRLIPLLNELLESDFSRPTSRRSFDETERIVDTIATRFQDSITSSAQASE